MIEWGQWGEKSLDFILTPTEKDARINILEGSVRSSKTVTMIPKWIEYIRKGPKGLLLMTGVSKDTIYDNVLNDFFDTIGEENYKYNRNTGELTVFYKYNENGHIYSGKRRIKVIGAKDEGSEKYLRGKTIAGAYCDELSLMPEKFFKQLLNRMSVKGAKLYGTTNPDTPFHYLYTEYITSDVKIKSGMVKIWHFGLEDNPNLSDEYKDFLRGAYRGVWFDRMVLGLWVMAEGRIYDCFDDDNLFDDAGTPSWLKTKASRYIACDYGTTNPMVFLDIYDDGDTIWIMQEYYYDSRKKGRQKDDIEYVNDLKEFLNGEYPRFVIIDPSAASFKIILRNNGFRVKDADNDVKGGIRMVSSLIVQKKIKVHKGCEYLRKEFSAYVWDEDARVKRGIEQPLKQNDHGCDALRYYVKTNVAKRRLIG